MVDKDEMRSLSWLNHNEHLNRISHTKSFIFYPCCLDEANEIFFNKYYNQYVISMSPDPEGFWCEYCDNNEDCPIHNTHPDEDF